MVKNDITVREIKTDFILQEGKQAEKNSLEEKELKGLPECFKSVLRFSNNSGYRAFRDGVLK